MTFHFSSVSLARLEIPEVSWVGCPSSEGLWVVLEWSRLVGLVMGSLSGLIPVRAVSESLVVVDRVA